MGDMTRPAPGTTPSLESNAARIATTSTALAALVARQLKRSEGELLSFIPAQGA